MSALQKASSRAGELSHLLQWRLGKRNANGNGAPLHGLVAANKPVDRPARPLCHCEEGLSGITESGPKPQLSATVQARRGGREGGAEAFLEPKSGMLKRVPPRKHKKRKRSETISQSKPIVLGGPCDSSGAPPRPVAGSSASGPSQNHRPAPRASARFGGQTAGRYSADSSKEHQKPHLRGIFRGASFSGTWGVLGKCLGMVGGWLGTARKVKGKLGVPKFHLNL